MKLETITPAPQTQLPLDENFFSRTPLVCASELIGCELVWGRCSGLVVETEAYAALGDEACHTFMRRGARKFVDDHPAGTAYVYLNYGMHWLFNVLIKGGSEAGFVLIRALEPRAGVALMKRRRGLDDVRKLCSGPGKLTQALKIPGSFHGESVCRGEQRGFRAAASPQVIADTRVGISRAADLPWRFLWKGSPFLSRGPMGKGPLP